VEVGSRVVEVGHTSFTVGHGVFMGDQCLATGETVHVHVRKGEPIPFTTELRTALEADRSG
jgi:acyl-CoA thioester hydrolase